MKYIKVSVPVGCPCCGAVGNWLYAGCNSCNFPSCGHKHRSILVRK